ncbi:hypothetical protein GO755_27080 [Spirosoma sp. HMF4905]|uniref:Uncharacterized protein n=1 Tax=Spirosoma arboris TaxID=2682092 RepID=A0A7K1SIT6_9BACT|nr:hypothetical protein [Spirosoma arboris]MVM33731.1 hypothetical protein [Spirosoma arboris]
MAVAKVWNGLAKPKLTTKSVYPLKDYTLDLPQAKMWLPGKWKLIKQSSMVLNSTLPNVELVIGENQISVIDNGTQADKVDYEVVKLAYQVGHYLQITTNAQPREDNWYVRNPVLYINKNRMYIDLGRAQDLPAYEFSKVN